MYFVIGRKYSHICRIYLLSDRQICRSAIRQICPMLSRRYAEDEDKPAWERPAIASFCVGVWGAARRKVRLDQVNVEFRVTVIDQDPSKKSPTQSQGNIHVKVTKSMRRNKKMYGPPYTISPLLTKKSIKSLNTSP